MAKRRKHSATNPRHSIANPVPATRGYRGGFRDSFFLFHHESRPPFAIVTARQMQLDPIVKMALSARDGMLLLAQCRVTDAPPRIREFVERQWRAIWNRSGVRIFAARCYGYMGYEVMYRRCGVRQFRGMWEFDSVRDFSPRDTRVLLRKGAVAGVKVNNIWPGTGGAAGPVSVNGAFTLRASDDSRKGYVLLEGMKGLWINYNPRYGSWYGQPLLEHAYAPWWEKWQRGGAIPLRQMRMLKDAWVGDWFRYPLKQYPDGAGGWVSGRDIVREIAENRMSGGIFGVPAEYDANGNPLFEYNPPSNVSGSTQIHEYKSELDSEILNGLGVPREVLEASKTGSGYSGRSIPMMLFLSMLQSEGEEFTRQIDEQIIRPLVRLNFGDDPSYELEMLPLVNTVTSILASGGNPISSGDSEGPGRQPSNGFGRPAANERPDDESFSQMSAVRSPGCRIGGVYYGRGDWVDGEALRWATRGELERLRECSNAR